MYACAVRFVLEPYSEWEANHMGDVASHFLHEKKGFVDLVLLGEYETGDYQWITFWESKDVALQAVNEWCDAFMNLLGDYGVLNKPYVQFYGIQPVKHLHTDG